MALILVLCAAASMNFSTRRPSLNKFMDRPCSEKVLALINDNSYHSYSNNAKECS